MTEWGELLPPPVGHPRVPAGDCLFGVPVLPEAGIVVRGVAELLPCVLGQEAETAAAASAGMR